MKKLVKIKKELEQELTKLRKDINYDEYNLGKRTALIYALEIINKEIVE